MQFAQLDHIRLAYEAVGSGDPVVCLHGGMFGDGYAPLAAEPALTSRFRVIRYHRRGYAESDRPATYSIAEQAADCLNLMRHLGVERAHVVTNDRGGPIGLKLAQQAPDFVGSLTLTEMATREDSTNVGGPMMEQMGQLFQRVLAGDNLPVAMEELIGVVFGRTPAELERKIPGGFAQAVDVAPICHGIEMDAMDQFSFTREDAAKITCPVLAVVGAASPPLFQAAHKRTMEWFPTAEALTIPRGDHGLYIFESKSFAEGLARFFDRHPLGGERHRAD